MFFILNRIFISFRLTKIIEKMKKTLIYVFLSAFFMQCIQEQDGSEDHFYHGFQEPPAEARPFVRWWWNGNQIVADELIRQLDVLHQAGIGGVEINPIEMPQEAPDLGLKPLSWGSKEWNEMVALTSREASQRDMITDLIVGTGWPFGGEFLQPEEVIQRITIDQIEVKGPGNIQLNQQQLLERLVDQYRPGTIMEAQSNQLHFIRMVPRQINNLNQVKDLMPLLNSSETVYLDIPEGTFEIIYGFKQKGHRQVMHGTPGAAGPVMDHYKKNVTQAYLNRLKKIEQDTGIPLKDLIRALFCDSIELAGANWTDDFEDIFRQTYGYDLKPYYPFVFYQPYQGYSDHQYGAAFSDQIKRVRYDYNRLMVELFLDNFTRTFQDFASQNGLLARYQAYGTPFLMGMVAGNMIPDIPESNNWIYSAPMDTPEWQWSKGHGYMIWNLYAAAGGHLTGRKIISCEAMTNTRGVFKTSLEDIKQADDMNFITGINHTVLHGYNYSPPEAGFPGWIRFGAYFNEQNTWWPYFDQWVDYNARLSYIFQHSQPVKDIAILAPTGDLWSTKGLDRVPFHMEPWYVHELWQPISQWGSSCDYINEDIIQQGNKQGGKLHFGPMSYKLVILSGLKSIHPETASGLLEYVKQGGKLVLIDSIPDKSLSYQDASANDQLVQQAFQALTQEYQDQVWLVESPAEAENLLEWTSQLFNRVGLSPNVFITQTDADVYQIHQTHDQHSIYFFTNSHRQDSARFTASFEEGQKTAWRWDPETGQREVFFSSTNDPVEIGLAPLQSLLLVFEDHSTGTDTTLLKPAPRLKTASEINSGWQARFFHANGKVEDREFSQLPELSQSTDPFLNTFAGEISYKARFNNTGEDLWMDLGQVHRGISAVYINGELVGEKWYGQHLYHISPYMVAGENQVEIKLTTCLANYTKSLKENPVAQRWTRAYEKIPAGLTGPVRLLKPVSTKAL